MKLHHVQKILPHGMEPISQPIWCVMTGGLTVHVYNTEDQLFLAAQQYHNGNSSEKQHSRQTITATGQAFSS